MPVDTATAGYEDMPLEVKEYIEHREDRQREHPPLSLPSLWGRGEDFARYGDRDVPEQNWRTTPRQKF